MQGLEKVEEMEWRGGGRAKPFSRLREKVDARSAAG
jgi:hypothetical protein